MKQSPSVSQGHFAKVEGALVQRSTFDRSHSRKMTVIGSALHVCFVDEALPGDTFNVRMNVFGRMQPTIQPYMDHLAVDYHFFSIPYRLLWDNFQAFMGEDFNVDQPVTYLLPILQDPVAGNGHLANSLADHMGIPTLVPNLEISALPFRAYHRVFNEWYRAQAVQPIPVYTETGDGPDVSEFYVLQPRQKRHDYFTSSNPWPQKGAEVQIGLGSQAPVIFPDPTTVAATAAGTPTFSVGGSTLTLKGSPSIDNADWSALTGSGGTASWVDVAAEVKLANLSGVYADLSSATAVTINDLRQAITTQQFLERDARGGTRYVETIRSHFGISSSDARHMRSEYLGGGTSSINVNPIAQTTPADNPTVDQGVGNLSSYVTTSGQGIGFTKSFTEHCVVLGLCSVRGNLHYQQGLEKMWSRRTKFDLFWPTFQNLGEQAILNKELYATGEATDEDVFGYQERYAEYRYKNSTITGAFRSNASQSLDTFHLAQDFQFLPELDQIFLRENPPVQRLVQVVNQPEVLLDLWFNFKAARPMATYATPGLNRL